MQYRDFDFYLEKAKEQTGLSNNKLGALIGISGGAMGRLHQGYSLPSPSTLVKLANIGGVDPHIALLDLNIWKAKEVEKPYYVNILEGFKKSVATILCAGLLGVVGGGPVKADGYKHIHNTEYTLSRK